MIGLTVAICFSGQFWFAEMDRQWHHAQARGCESYLDGSLAPSFDMMKTYCNADIVEVAGKIVYKPRCTTVPTS